MSKLQWDESGKHFYETGVDHGILYVKGANGDYGKGVAWNGLTAVTESPEGAEETAVYADNIKYLSLRSAEEFKATIEAYTYPDEFEVCDGSAELSAGVKIGQQARSTFAFCYRTKVGNENNADLGYKIHIIYGATASPSERPYATVNDSPEAISFSWEISTVPVSVANFKPTAHLEIDTTKFTSQELQDKLELLLAAIEGTSDVDLIQEIAAVITNFTGDPTLLLPDQVAALLA